MRTQNDIDFLYRHKSLEEIKAEIRKFGLVNEGRQKLQKFDLKSQKENTAKNTPNPDFLAAIFFLTIALVFLAFIA